MTVEEMKAKAGAVRLFGSLGDGEEEQLVLGHVVIV